MSTHVFITSRISDILKLYKDLTAKESNVLIGGSCALIMHGLDIDKEPEDIDMVIYNPTKEQQEFLDILSSIIDNPHAVDSYNRRSFKLKIKNTNLDILVEANHMPTDILYHNHYGEYIAIQSVKNIFEARKSYNVNNIRRKDVVSSLKLKELNFNVI